MFPKPQLDPKSSVPLYRQLYEYLRDQIHSGAIAGGGRLPATRELAGLLDLNRTTIAAAYELLEGADPEVSMRIKMGQTSDVVALVKADGKFYLARKEVKVTLGGCGG